MPEKDLCDIKAVVRSLPPEQQWKWAKEFGTGERTDINSILSQINTDAIEQAACDVLKRVLGIEVLTRVEREEYLAQEQRALLRRNVEANEKLAAAAEGRRQAEQPTGEKRVPELFVFISWSTSKSHQVAKAFRDWLPKVIPEAKPWVSSMDIRKGKPWFPAVAEQLSKSKAGIICVTPENLGKPWIYFEAGAIAHASADSDCVVCSYLVGVSKEALGNTPLAQLQLTDTDKDDTLRMIQSLNQCLSQPHSEKLIEGNFHSKWPSLQGKLAKLLAEATPVSTSPTPPAPPAEVPLSDLARQILLAAVAGQRQTVTVNTNNVTGFCLGAGGKTLIETHDGRQEAQGRAAVDELLRRELIEDRWHRGEVLPVTEPGYRMAERLVKERKPKGELKPTLTHDDDILVALQSWFQTKCQGTRTPQIAFADVDTELNLQPGTAARFLERAAQNAGWVADAKGPNLITFRHRLVRPG